MKNIIFLDIDGVLNSSNSKELILNIVDLNKLKMLAKLINLTDSEIIIISTRRRYESERNDLIYCFKQCDLNISFIPNDINYRNRSDEILKYLGNRKYNNFVILDDLDLGYSNNKLLNDHFILIDGIVGLTKNNCLKAIEILLNKQV